MSEPRQHSGGAPAVIIVVETEVMQIWEREWYAVQQEGIVQNQLREAATL